jgi:hypothetical protein
MAAHSRRNVHSGVTRPQASVPRLWTVPPKQESIKSASTSFVSVARAADDTDCGLRRAVTLLFIPLLAMGDKANPR